MDPHNSEESNTPRTNLQQKQEEPRNHLRGIRHKTPCSSRKPQIPIRQKLDKGTRYLYQQPVSLPDPREQQLKQQWVSMRRPLPHCRTSRQTAPHRGGLDSSRLRNLRKWRRRRGGKARSSRHNTEIPECLSNTNIHIWPSQEVATITVERSPLTKRRLPYYTQLQRTRGNCNHRYLRNKRSFLLADQKLTRRCDPLEQRTPWIPLGLPGRVSH